MTRWIALTVVLPEDVLNDVQARAREEAARVPVNLSEWCANAVAQELRRRQIADEALQHYRAAGLTQRARRSLQGQPVRSPTPRRCRLCNIAPSRQRTLCHACYMRVYRFALEIFGHRKEA